MKKACSILLLCALAAGLYACRENHTPPQDSLPETSAPEVPSAEETISETPALREGSLPQRLLFLGDPESTHIFNECGVSVPDAEETAAGLAQTYQIHAGVVITDQLDGKEPSAAAQECYDVLYGKDSSGFLVLINNDTGQDFVYTSGVCSLYLTEDKIGYAIAQATDPLVQGDYGTGVSRLLELGELCPRGIYDRSNLLNREQTDTVAAMAAEFTETRREVWIIEKAPDAEEGKDALREYAIERLKVLGADSLLVMETSAQRCIVAYEGEYHGSSAQELTQLWQETENYPVMTTITAYYESLY